jgi:ubiquinone/menaquinone biosynthesis C-methylase UbiE
VLEVSFGTGWLLTRYPAGVEVHGVDYNRAMTHTARANLVRVRRATRLVRADVAHLPYPDACFDTLVNTMAFSGYPDGRAALAEMKRVLRPGGRLVLVDFARPPEGRRLGRWLAGLMEKAGDVLREMGPLFDVCGLEWTEQEIGGFGSVRLWVATRPE